MSEATHTRALNGSWWIALALAVVAVFIGLVLSRPRVPEYQGRSAKMWLGDVFCGRPGNSQAAAIAAFRAMGTNGVTFLVEALDQREHPLNQIYRRAYGKLPLATQRWLPPPVDFDTLANSASLALLNIRDEAHGRTFPRLLRLLEAGNPRTRLHVAGVVQHYALNYPDLNLVEFKPELVRALRDTNDWVRIEIAATLIQARIDLPDLTNALTPSLTNSDSNIRDAARQTIANAVAVFASTNHHAP